MTEVNLVYYCLMKLFIQLALQPARVPIAIVKLNAFA